MKTVITYGTFDLLHYGHMNLLKRASAFGDRLIVGVSTDEFALEKGKKTCYDLKKRMEMVADLRYVDLVIPEYSMAQKLTDCVKYKVDYFILGSDYCETFKNMPEYQKLIKMCKVIFLERTPNISTTMLKAKLKNDK